MTEPEAPVWDDVGGAIVEAWRLPDEEVPPLDYPWDVPVEEGWHYDVPMEEYLSWPILSASLLLLLTHHHERTPAYLQWAMTREREESGSTDAAKLGSLTHTALLEPHLLDTEYILEPVADPEVYTKADGTPASNPKATAAWKEMYAALEATGKTIITPEQWDAAVDMVAAVQRHERAKQLIAAEGPVEATLVAREPTTGLLVKIRPDKLIPAAGYHINVKTADNAGREPFMRSCYNFGYYVGAALYERMLRAAGWNHRRTIFLVLETAGNKAVATWEADVGFMDAGHQVLDTVLPVVAECVQSDTWPDYPPHIESISLPHWAFARVDNFVAGY